MLRAKLLASFLLLCWRLEIAFAVHWELTYGREECVSAWVPQDQWDLVMQTVSFSGDLHTTDVKTAEMETQIEAGMLIYNMQRVQLAHAAVDMTIKDPLGNVIHSKLHANEEEVSLPAHGRRGPWQLCMQVSRTGKWHARLLGQITHFIVNHRQLMGTHLEAPKTTMPNVTANGTDSMTGGKASVAGQYQVVQLQEALQEVGMYLQGAYFEMQHRLAVGDLQLHAARRQSTHLLRWMLAINAVVVAVAALQVLVISHMFRDGAKDPSIISPANLSSMFKARTPTAWPC